MTVSQVDFKKLVTHVRSDSLPLKVRAGTELSSPSSSDVTSPLYLSVCLPCPPSQPAVTLSPTVQTRKVPPRMQSWDWVSAGALNPLHGLQRELPAPTHRGYKSGEVLP